METHARQLRECGRYPDKLVDTILAILAIGIFAVVPFLGAAAAASIAISALRDNRIPTNGWMILPFLLLGFSLICYAVTLWTLSYSPDTKPGLLNPILVVLVLDSICLLPIAFMTALRGFVAIRDRKLEAGLDFIAVALYGLLYIPYVALHEYYPHV